MMATPQQIDEALDLLYRAGYSVRWMRSEHKELGASMRERRGLVRDWLAGMVGAEIQALIETLRARLAARARPPATSPPAPPPAAETHTEVAGEIPVGERLEID